jgi:Fe-S cluster assembly ATP-binding protein
MNPKLIERNLNVGFSGGEKKKNEVLQLKLLKPSFIILDELDSGLDVDSLKIAATNIAKYKKDNPNTAILIITHLSKILDYIKPDYVHIVANGKILATGDYGLAKEIEKNGYNEYLAKSNIMLGDESHE